MAKSKQSAGGKAGVAAEGPLKVPLSAARRLLLRSQGLDGAWRLPKGKKGVLRVIESLGYVQIDTIAVVQRAHHHTIWARHGQYHPDMLDALQREDRKVFEYWDHAASVVPMENYRYYLPRMQGFAAPGSRTRQFLDANKVLVDGVLARIRDEGALGSSDFDRPDGPKRRGWWDWKPAKRALEELFNAGQLMVSHRVKFERKYDLPERVIPSGTDTSMPSREERIHHYIRRAMECAGFIAGDSLARLNGGELDGGPVGELIRSKSLVPFTIEGAAVDETFYASPAGLRRMEELDGAGAPDCLHILSPFDNCVIRRSVTRRLFGFDYRLEAYLNEKNRKYGYFCLPILWGDRFIGRTDAKAVRETGTLVIRNLHVEPACRDFGDAVGPLAGRLVEFAAFNGCTRIRVERTTPARYRSLLTGKLHQPQGM